MSEIISPQQLFSCLKNDRLVILHTSMQNPVTGASTKITKDYIPGAIHFDFETKICDRNSALPHTLPDQQTMSRELQRLGINNDSQIVVYDDVGLYSAPRVWFMLKLAGLQHVQVLDGGFPAWLKQQFPTSRNLSTADTVGDVNIVYRNEMLATLGQVKAAINNDSIQIIDARSQERYSGSVDEPRKGVRRGHIPDSLNLPFASVINNDGRLQPQADIERTFKNCGAIVGKHWIFSCGSGVTACILGLAASYCKLENWSIYDGSWSQWGADQTLPVEC